MVRQAVPLQPVEKTMVEQISTCSPWRTPCQSRWRHLKEAVTPWEAHTGASSWQDLWPHGERSPCRSRFAGRTCDPVEEPTLEQSVPEGLHLMGETHIGEVREGLQPMGRTHIGAVGGGLSPVGGTPRWSRGSM
ncbi:zinc finger and BTB domain-containing protein 5 [Grus japonensis]|uniref:Zinc finger and BTB domain-containing protein 5 n=1 Tax=Grus japonensis TaxID=30415 RepID=A0ABC9WD69_GRUJA